MERACARLGIPGPRDTTDGFAAEAPVGLVKALVERARELTTRMACDHRMIGYDDYELLDTARVLGAHAEDYISAATPNGRLARPDGARAAGASCNGPPADIASTSADPTTLRTGPEEKGGKQPALNERD